MPIIPADNNPHEIRNYVHFFPQHFIANTELIPGPKKGLSQSMLNEQRSERNENTASRRRAA